MCYGMHLKLLSAKLKERAPNTSDTLILNIEFTDHFQEDGHGPWHGDHERDFAEAIVRNLPREPIAELLQANEISGFGNISGCGVIVHKTDRSENFMPVFAMEVRICFSRNETYTSLANQLLDSVTWQTTKAAIADPGNYKWLSDIYRKRL